MRPCTGTSPKENKATPTTRYQQQVCLSTFSILRELSCFLSPKPIEKKLISFGKERKMFPTLFGGTLNAANEAPPKQHKKYEHAFVMHHPWWKPRSASWTKYEEMKVITVTQGKSTKLFIKKVDVVLKKVDIVLEICSCSPRHHDRSTFQSIVFLHTNTRMKV